MKIERQACKVESKVCCLLEENSKFANQKSIGGVVISSMSSISRKGEKCMSGFCSGKEGKLPEERVAGCVRPWMEAGEK